MKTFEEIKKTQICLVHREKIMTHKGQQHMLEGTGQSHTFLTKEEVLDFIDKAIAM